MNHADTFDDLNAVAIIGLTGRFPGAKNLGQFWQNLRDGVESITVFTDEELLSSGIDPAILCQPQYIKAGAILEDIELFDAEFFGFSPKEAEITDPQQRLFLECAWEALEGAGYNCQTYTGRIGVYAGVSLSTYFLSNLYPKPELIKSVGSHRLSIGNSQDFLPTFVSYKLNLKGPSINIQTACSTSLVAVHLACQSLLNGESDIVLAGGVSINVPHKTGYSYQEGGILSPDGHCRAFDAKAQGTVSGNGVGIVVLKRLEDALADGDCIHALIKGSAINNDGSLKVGYTAPSVEGQAKVIAEALAMARVEPETIGYIETHGTGTVLGDPIEIAALTQAFHPINKNSFCAIASVKTNIGHLDVAAGVIGLIKTVLALKHKQIPPSLNFQEPNPQIDFNNSPFYVANQLLEWQSNNTPRRAGVSSFGIGGTNAHLILEEAPPVDASSSSRPWQLLLLCAKTNSALETATANLVEYLKQHPTLNLADITYTLQIGREAFGHRRMLVCQNLDDAVTVLETPVQQRIFTKFTEPSGQQVVFMFPGQGTQYVNMGRELYETEPIFRKQVDHCCELLKSHLGLDLRTLLYPQEENKKAAAQQLQQTYITQPALFVVEYALAQLWIAWGVHPSAMIGHSIGEYVAACIADVFPLQDALILVAIRGKLMQQLPIGTMLAVPLSETELQSQLGNTLSLAAINGTENCVVSGSVEAIDNLQNQLTERGIDCRRLHTSHAFHSQMMDSILEPFREQISKISLNAPKIPFISNVTGTWITAAEATDAKYWAKHLRQTVRFAEGITKLQQLPNRILLEVGPGQTLSTLANRQKVAEQMVLCSLKHPQNQQSDIAFLLNTLGRLWLEAIQVDWSKFYANEQRHRIPLPTYPFERKRYWIDHSRNSESNPFVNKQENLVPEEKDLTEHSLQDKHNLTISILQDILSSALGINSSEIDPHKDFIEIGINSLLLLQINRAIEQKFGVKIPFYQLIDNSLTIDSLAIYIVQELPPEKLVAVVPPQESISSITPPVTTEASFVVRDSHQQTLNQRDEIPVANTAIEQIITQHLQVMSKLVDLLPDKGSSQYSTFSQSQQITQPSFSHSVASTTASIINQSSSYQKIEQETLTGLTSRQQKHLDTLIARFVKRTPESKRLSQAYRSCHANSRAVTGFFPYIKEMVYPIHGQRGEGARLWDVDGNEYVDISMGFGTLLFGHSPSFVIEAVQQQIQQGILHGPQSHLSGQVAELICQLTGAERAAFCNNGTEAVMGAIRLARATTGRSKIALFAGSYHGNLDEALVKEVVANDGTRRYVGKFPGIPQHLTENVIVLNYGNSESLDILKAHAHELAAILVEPVQSTQPDCQPKEFLRQLRQLTQETGTVLIFDEVITGFRMHPGGIQALWNIQADITTYGKAVGAGIPIGVIAGKATFMDAFDGGMWNYGDDSYPQTKTTFFAGTFFKHPLVMSAAWAALNHLRESGPQLQEKLAKKTTKLAETLNNYFEQKQVAIRVINFGSLFRFTFQTNCILSNLLYYYLLEKGVYVWEGRNFYLSTAHTDADIEYVIQAVKESVVEMQIGELLPPSPFFINSSYTTSVSTTKFSQQELEEALVTIQPQGSKKPLFFIHPIGGNVFCYKDLAHYLGSEQPFYGLQAPGLYGEREPHTCIEDMASHYIAALRTIQPEGPYFLGGWSSGSFVAFEMAQQLQNKGHQVALLVLLDNAAPIDRNKFVSFQQDNSTKILANFAQDLANSANKKLSVSSDKFQQMKPDKQLNYAFEQLKLANLIPASFNIESFCSFLSVYQNNLQASWNYVPQVYPNRMILFQANDSNEGFDYPDDHSWGWNQLSSKPMEIVTVSGNHYTMLTKPHVQVLAEQLKNYLNEAQSQV